MNLLTFTIATLIGRTLHFATIITVLVAFRGQQLLQLIEKYERWIIGLGIAALVGFGIAYATQ
jgi:membrane protein DedA with SNARE-associated domain